MNTEKIAIILRGVPGSGKSSFISMIKATNTMVDIHAIDELHIDDNGDFFWDEENAERLYTLNFANFVISCERQTPVVVCDAINIKISDFEKYVEIARQYKYKVYVVTPDPPTPKMSSKKNKHHTSALQAKEMYDRWESWPTKEMIKGLKNDNK